mmetsp:Transcript_89176/g.186348  ORF Transcript_89176/g.186348 Transcript_89176/m.186348 type:complete len:180 (-) Transcript_89176:169-708(-)
MALRCSLQLLNGYSPGRARTLWSPTAYVNPHKPNDSLRQFRLLQRLAKQNGCLKRVQRIQRRELPCDSRARDLKDKIYFERWHAMKYYTQVIKYSVEKNLDLTDPVEDSLPKTEVPHHAEDANQRYAEMHAAHMAWQAKQENKDDTSTSPPQKVPQQEGLRGPAFTEKQLKAKAMARLA